MGFDGAPERVLERNLSIKIALGLLLLPFAGLAYGAYRGFANGSTGGGLIIAGMALVPLGLFAWLIQRERSMRIELHAEGIKATRGGTSQEIRWDDVGEIWLHAVNIADGGGAVARLAIQGLPGDPKGLDHRSSHVEVRIVGGGATIELSKSYLGCVEAYRYASGKVNPRLLADAQQRLDRGERVGFGPKAALSPTTVTLAGHELAFTELEKVVIEQGVMVARKPGKWLAAAKVPVREIANLEVFCTLLGRRTGTDLAGTDGDLVRTRFQGTPPV